MSENLIWFSEESLSSSCGPSLFPLQSIYIYILLFIYLLNPLSHDSAWLSRTLGLCFLVTAESEPSHFTDKTALSVFVLSIKQACQHCTHRLIIFIWGVSTRTRLSGFLLDRRDATDGITVLWRKHVGEVPKVRAGPEPRWSSRSNRQIILRSLKNLWCSWSLDSGVVAACHSDRNPVPQRMVQLPLCSLPSE